MELSVRRFKSLSGQLSITISKNPSVLNTICITSISLPSWDYLCKFSTKIDVPTDEGNSPSVIGTLNKKWNWSSCRKVVLSAKWTHGLRAQLVGASGGGLQSHSGQLSITISTHIYTSVLLNFYYISYTQTYMIIK